MWLDSIKTRQSTRQINLDHQATSYTHKKRYNYGMENDIIIARVTAWGKNYTRVIFLVTFGRTNILSDFTGTRVIICEWIRNSD